MDYKENIVKMLEKINKSAGITLHSHYCEGYL